MKKTYVLDTSVIVYDPNCIQSFKNSNIIIQIYVLNELDKIKKEFSDIGKNARIFVRMLDDLRMNGKLSQGVVLEDINSILTIDTKVDNLDAFGDKHYVDNKILACAYRLNKDYDVILVTNDINLRVRAEAFDIISQNYIKDSDNKKTHSLYSGVVFIKNAELSGELYNNKCLPCDYPELQNILPNECVCITDENNNGITIGRRIDDKIHIIKEQNLWGIKTRNKEQIFATDLLLDPKVPLVSLIGRAGTGKTLLTIAACLEMLINKQMYSKFIIYRPIQPIGNELGYLPGNMEEKLAPWMEAILDSFEFLMTSKKNTSKRKKILTKDNWKKDWKEKLAQYSDQIFLEPITYIRGRSIQNALIFFDEVQNITPNQIKTVLTRVGEGSKIILTGDVEQTDNPKLDAINNGLTYVASAFRTSSLAGHITLKKGERSKLATEASHIL